jgi:hypothetical protein
MNALGSRRSARANSLSARSIELVIIKTPFPDIARHVFNSKRTGSERKCADGRTFGIAIVDIAIAPGKTVLRSAKLARSPQALLAVARHFGATPLQSSNSFRPAIFSLPWRSAAPSRWRNPALAGWPYSTFSLTKNFRIASTKPSMS